jgi:hypothetical protein
VLVSLGKLLTPPLPHPIVFDPLSLLFLEFRGRSVTVFRTHCFDYHVLASLTGTPGSPRRLTPVNNVVAVSRRSLGSLRFFPHDDLVLLKSISGYPDVNKVELSKEVWPSVNAVIHTVTHALESGASPMASDQWPLPGQRPRSGGY